MALHMNFFTKTLEYFFSFKIGLNQKWFIYHYFLDLLIYFLVVLIFWVPGYLLMISPFADFKILGLSLPVFVITINAILCFLFLILNRLSILVRRLDYLKMNKRYSLLLFVPLVGFILDFYLMTVPDEKKP